MIDDILNRLTEKRIEIHIQKLTNSCRSFLSEEASKYLFETMPVDFKIENSLIEYVNKQKHLKLKIVECHKNDYTTDYNNLGFHIRVESKINSNVYRMLNMNFKFN